VAAVVQAVEVDQRVVRTVINERGEVSREEKRMKRKIIFYYFNKLKKNKKRDEEEKTSYSRKWNVDQSAPTPHKYLLRLSSN
jgi:hypothetical protein